MRRLWPGLVIFAAIIGISAPVSAQTIGVVLMHGNTDSPSGSIAPLATAMEDAGYLVEQPDMCWSYRRRRDRPFLNCLAELEAPIARLTGRGARAIVVAGMSQGGIAALAFGARRLGLAGIIALAPAGAPERLVTVFPRLRKASLKRGRWSPPAAAMNAPPSRLEYSWFILVDTTATIYLSFFDPTGPVHMLDNTSR